MTIERTKVAKLKGNPLTLIGPEIKKGEQAPDFTLNKDLMTEVSLKDYQGKIKLVSVVPSLDTGVCDAQTKRFNEEAANLGDDIVILTVSADLPFAQARWCGANNIEQVITLSDYKSHSFGKAYGVLIKELHLDMRSIFVIDKNDTIQYVQYVEEMTEHPDYEAALSAAKAIV